MNAVKMVESVTASHHISQANDFIARTPFPPFFILGKKNADDYRDFTLIVSELSFSLCSTAREPVVPL